MGQNWRLDFTCAVAPAAGSPEDRAAAWARSAGRPIALVPPAPPGSPWADGALAVRAETAGDVAGLVA